MNRRRLEEELSRDIREHIEIDTRENIARGMSPEEARFAALRKFGNVARVQEETRNVWGWMWLIHFARDVRHSLRTFSANPGFTAVAIITLALGIGMTTAVFSVVNAVLIRPLPYPAAGRLVWLADYNERFQMEAVAGPDFFDWRRLAQSFERMAAYGFQQMSIAGSGMDAGQIGVVSFSGDFWEVTGARPALGQFPAPGDLNGVVITQTLFQRLFSGDPRAIGRPVTLDGMPRVIAAVLPGDFRFVLPLSGPALRPKDVEAYILAPITPENQVRGRNMAILNVAGRLKPGVPLAAAHAELDGIQSAIAKANPRGFYDLIKLRVTPMRDKLVGNERMALLILIGAVALVLLIACANIANLLLGRASSRQKEIAIRAALGAGTRRIALQFLAEGLVLASAGGLAGLLLARLAIDVMIRIAPTGVPRLAETSIDARALWFALALSLVTGILFGLAPALSFARGRLALVLKEGGRSSLAGSAGLALRRLLVTAEIALALLLLIGAGLLAKSFWRLNARPAGFQPESILLLHVSLSGQQYRAMPAQLAYLGQVLERAAGVPGVQAAGLFNSPIQGFVQIAEAPPPPPGQAIMTIYNSTSPGYFTAMGIRLLQGRWLADTDPDGLILVNETFSRRVFGNTGSIGKKIRIPGGAQARIGEIAGVVSDVKYSRLDADPVAEVYLPFRQSPFVRQIDVVVRIAGHPSAVAPALRDRIAGIDRTQPVYDVQTLEHALADSVSPRRFNFFLLAVFSGTAMMLALVGIYGVMSYAVTQRTHEIGVRIALGARRTAVVGMVVRQGMILALAGIAGGVLAALALTRLMRSLLYEVTPADPATFIAVCLALSVAAVVASCIPALRAAGVDPAVALRYE